MYMAESCLLLGFDFTVHLIFTTNIIIIVIIFCFVVVIILIFTINNTSLILLVLSLLPELIWWICHIYYLLHHTTTRITAWTILSSLFYSSLIFWVYTSTFKVFWWEFLECVGLRCTKSEITFVKIWKSVDLSGLMFRVILKPSTIRNG